MDADGTGVLSAKELQDYMVTELHVDPATAAAACKKLDVNGDNDVSKAEYMKLFTEELKARPTLNPNTLKRRTLNPKTTPKLHSTRDRRSES